MSVRRGVSRQTNFTIGNNIWNASDAMGNWYVDSNNRMRLNITAVQGPSNDDLNLRIDDITIPGNIYSSFLQIPPIATPFASYYVYHVSQPLSLSVTNQGPNGIWLVSATTRIIFQTITKGVYSAAAVAISDNGTAGCSSTGLNIMGVQGNGHGYVQDSYFIPVYGTTLLGFTTPSEVPSSCSSSGLLPIQAGYHYRLYVNLSGYDDQGNSVFKTVYVGLVRVLP